MKRAFDWDLFWMAIRAFIPVVLFLIFIVVFTFWIAPWLAGHAMP